MGEGVLKNGVLGGVLVCVKCSYKYAFGIRLYVSQMIERNKYAIGFVCRCFRFSVVGWSNKRELMCFVGFGMLFDESV